MIQFMNVTWSDSKCQKIRHMNFILSCKAKSIHHIHARVNKHPQRWSCASGGASTGIGNG